MSTVRLRHLAQVNPSTPEFDKLSVDDRLTFLPMENVWSGPDLNITLSRRKTEVSSGYTRFKDGDVLVPKITPTFEAGRSVLVHGLLNGVGAGTTELHVLRPGPQIDPRFLLYVVSTHSFLKLGEAEMYGVAGQKRVPDDFLRDLPVRLPMLQDQRRIANFLDIETARIDKLATFQKNILRGVDEREAALLDTALDQLAIQYGTIPLRRYLLGVEQGVSPQADSAPAAPNEWGVLKVSCLRPERFFPDENKRLPGDYEPDTKHEVREGDLLITRANTPALVGSTAVVPEVRKKLLLSDKIFRVHLDQRVSPHFVAAVARGRRVRDICAAASNGASQSMANIRFEEVKAWPIPAANRAAQEELVQYVRKRRAKMDALRARIERQSDLLAERRQALITSAVTGQFDVSSASGRGGDPA